jgi:CRISPR-associated exonuclease Cas4
MAPLVTWVALGVIAAGFVAAVAGTRALYLRRKEAHLGALVSVDERDRRAPLLRSERHGIAGRPDEIRRMRDGRWVPVEIKSRSTPPGGPPYSHRIQVAAYCLLVEDTTGRPPPHGLLRYSDGGEFRIPWDASHRAELLRLREEMQRPYDGRATPSVARCRHCPWRDACDVRAV